MLVDPCAVCAEQRPELVWINTLGFNPSRVDVLNNSEMQEAYNKYLEANLVDVTTLCS